MKTMTIAAGVALGSIASADVITHNDLTNGAQTANLSAAGGVTVTSTSRTFQAKTTSGFTAVGVKGGAVSGEIDGSESILFSFDGPVVVNAIEVGYLYTAGNYGDTWDESARFVVNDEFVFDLTATGATSATWTGAGTVENLSEGVQGQRGHWRVWGDDLFGAVTSLEMMGGNIGDRGAYSDFSFVSMSTATVPAPGAIAMLGLGGAIAGRRRRA